MYIKPDTPLSIGGVLDDGFKLTRAAFTQVFGILLIGTYISNAPYLFVEQIPEDPLAIFTPTFFIISIVASLFSLFITGWALCKILNVSEGKSISFGESAGEALSRYPALLMVMICYLLLVFLGSLALIVAGIILSLTLLFAPMLVFENMGFVDALKKSHDLVWGNWWRTAVIITVVFFIALVLSLVIGVLAGVATIFQADGGTSIMAVLTNWLITPLLTAAYMPVMYACGIAVFQDLKLRKEGSDLEARMSEAEATTL